MAMTLVETVTVGSGGAASIEFTNIPQTGKDLLVLVSARSSFNNARQSITAALNGSTSNFSARVLRAAGTDVGSFTDTSGYITNISAAQATASTFGNASIYIANYSVSANKSISVDGVIENNSSSDYWMDLNASQWANTAAITSLTLSTSPLFVQHSTASLYLVS